ncbi:MAG TPA: hypothetical protein VEI47_03505, partial [Gemmatimonadales bacterium]|nr:hypothetical protein [Gemmatimonadales bacterium]
AGSATKLVITTQPSTSAQSGAAFGTQPVIQLQDAASNNVSQSGVSVTAAPSGGSLVGTGTVTTNASGQAVFSGVGITATVGSYTLNFTSGSLTGIASNSISISAGAATKLFISTQPSSSAQSGLAFGTQPVVQLRDAANNNVSQSGVNVTVAPSGGSLVGSATVATNASGQAVFSGVGISGTVGSYTVNFTSGSLTGATSNSISLTPGNATQLVFVTQPSNTNATRPSRPRFRWPSRTPLETP